jgi:hypothetical protein
VVASKVDGCALVLGLLSKEPTMATETTNPTQNHQRFQTGFFVLWLGVEGEEERLAA